MRRLAVLVFSALVMCGCGPGEGLTKSGLPAWLGDVTSSDPTERGLSYVAAAIVVSAGIRAIFNK